MSLRFGPFQLDAAAGELLRDGARVRLQPQPVTVLALLASNAGRLACVNVDPRMDALRGTPAFQALIARMALAP